LGRHEVDAEALLDGVQAEGDSEMHLADAGRPEEQDVRGVADEVSVARSRTWRLSIDG
jgi:hypothetical protein